ncbi:unnamed protein product, partial [Mesorhabditis belari]|uniref:StAR-related lipid transfer protein 3 n=1 Tax=Mesorhabditis belari TaxID=2138241 RepID=A0AAF3E996_9BILA
MSGVSVSLHEPLLPSNERSLSKDRRRFVVISVFDCTLTVLLWLIWTVSKTDDWRTAFYQEINLFNPDFLKKSLFDIVMVAILRLFLLIIVYGFMRVNSWVPVALSTTITSIYLIIKVLFFFSKEQGGLPQYLLILSSFSISWFELWLMPFRVLARERAHDRPNEITAEAPPYYQQDAVNFAARHVGSRGHSRNPAGAINSADEFHSAIDFSSDDDRYLRGRLTTSVQRLSVTSVAPDRTAAYEACIIRCITNVDRLLGEARSGQWKTLRKSDPLVCQSSHGVFYVSALFSVSTRMNIFDSSWKNTTSWNDQVLETKTILNIDPNTEIFYSVSAPAMRGYIASRDFIDIRRVVVDEDNKIISGYFTSFEDPQIQFNHPDRSVVRGANGPSMIRVSSQDDGFNFEWMMQCDLRGGLPKRIVQSNMVSFFVRYIEKLRKHVISLDPTIAT